MSTSTMKPDEYAHRLARCAETAADQGFDAVLVSPGPDLAYLTGYDAKQLERLTCLIVGSDGTYAIVVPGLEEQAATASPLVHLGVEVMTWGETSDPYALVADRLGTVSQVCVDDRMWASKAFALRDAMPSTAMSAAGPVMRELRMRKSPAEIEALLEAGAAIDRVHRRVPEFLRAGVTERHVGALIAEAIREEGHVSVDFVIVASGPNGASPHHDVSDRVIESGEPVVVDIGGTMASGYCSDSTRVYSVGAPAAVYLERYAHLLRAQEAAVCSVAPGQSCESIDRAARDVLVEAGLGDAFIHRTGHGIGLETHEDPYIVEGNSLPLEAGMAFSVEPGFYIAGEHGARIEDIVICTTDGFVRCNNTPRELTVVE